MAQPQIFQINYDTIDDIRSRFDQMARATESLSGRLRRTHEAMMAESEGDWVDKYEAEMEGKVLPTLFRLREALEESSHTMQQINQTVAAAEDQAAALFGNAGWRIDDGPTNFFSSGGGGRGGAGSDKYETDLLEFLRNGNNSFKALGERRNDLLEKLSERFIKNEKWKLAFPGMADGTIGALLKLTDGKIDDALLELAGGGTKSFLNLSGKLGEKSLGVSFEIVDGVVKAFQEGDPKYAVSGGIKGLLTLHPVTKGIMIGNSIVQFGGEGVGWVVHEGSDWLSNGDPQAAEGYRKQSDDFRTALRQADLNKAIDAVSGTVVKLAQGDGEGAWNTLKTDGGEFLTGAANTYFEGSKMFWTTSASLYEKVTGTDTSEFVQGMQNFTWSDMRDTGEYLINESGERLKELGNNIDNTLDDVGRHLDQVGNKADNFLNSLGDRLENFSF